MTNYYGHDDIRTIALMAAVMVSQAPLCTPTQHIEMAFKLFKAVEAYDESMPAILKVKEEE